MFIKIGINDYDSKLLCYENILHNKSSNTYIYLILYKCLYSFVKKLNKLNIVTLILFAGWLLG